MSRPYSELGDYTTTGELMLREGVSGRGAPVQFYVGSPDGVLPARLGQLAIDLVNGDIYQATNDEFAWALRSLNVASSIAIARLGNADANVNVSTHGVLDWFVANTTFTAPRTLTTNRYGKYGAGSILNSFNASTGGQATSTVLMPATRSANANDSIELAAVSQVSSWGVATPNTTVAYGVGFQVPSGGNVRRSLRVYWGNAFNVARLTCTLDDGTTASVDIDTAGAIQTHTHEIVYVGGSVMNVTIKPISRYVGTQAIAFAAASLGRV